MIGFKSPDRERLTALFASSISFPDREETRTWSGNNNFFLVNARVGNTHYIMRENLIWRFLMIRQTAKLKSSPNFPTIRYVSFNVTQACSLWDCMG